MNQSQKVVSAHTSWVHLRWERGRPARMQAVDPHSQVDPKRMRTNHSFLYKDHSWADTTQSIAGAYREQHQQVGVLIPDLPGSPLYLTQMPITYVL